jgi:transposase InsO family protein
MDITYVHISKKHYYLITIIDGCSRFIVAWDLREKGTVKKSMKTDGSLSSQQGNGK